MRPLPWIAVGLVVVLLSADAGGWDLLPDPVGWAVVLVGLAALPPRVGWRGPVLVLGGVALVVAAATWPPYVATRVADADPAVVWTLGLPELACVGVLAHALAGAAALAGHRRDAAWWRTMRAVTVVVALLPAVVIGGDVEALRGPAAALTVLAPLAVVVLLALHAGRAWAQPATTGTRATGTTNGPPPEGRPAR